MGWLSKTFILITALSAEPFLTVNMSQITIDLLDAVKVQFLKQIFEDDFPERGMKAWLTKIEWNKDHCGYDLYFDFSEFEKENEKYFIEVYYPNRRTEELGIKKEKYTAIEAGCYKPKYNVCFFVSDPRNDELFAEYIKEYLKVID